MDVKSDILGGEKKSGTHSATVVSEQKVLASFSLFYTIYAIFCLQAVSYFEYGRFFSAFYATWQNWVLGLRIARVLKLNLIKFA